MGQIFLKLTHQDWVNCFTKLNRIELGVLFYFRTLDPFGDRKVEIKCEAIAEVLDVHRTSVSRALKKLEAEGFIDLEITGAKVKLKKQEFTDVHPRTDCASTHADVHPRTDCASTHENCASTHTDVHPRTNRTQKTTPSKDSEKPQTIKTYTDFIKTFSEREREEFFNSIKEIQRRYLEENWQRFLNYCFSECERMPNPPTLPETFIRAHFLEMARKFIRSAPPDVAQKITSKKQRHPYIERLHRLEEEAKKG